MNNYDIWKFGIRRRTFIKSMLVLTGAAATVGPSGCADYPKAEGNFAFLDDKTHAVIKSFSERIIPRGGAFEEGAEDIEVTGFFDRLVGAEPPEIQKNMRSGIMLLEHAPIFLMFKFKRFTQMTDDEKDLYLKKWEESGVTLFRGVFKGFKNLCTLGFFSNEKVWKYIGYDGPPI